MHNDLVRLINIAGTALEAEDRFLRKAITENTLAYPEGKGGILRINNERYYQFIITRALISFYQFPVAVEYNVPKNLDTALRWFPSW